MAAWQGGATSASLAGMKAAFKHLAAGLVLVPAVWAGAGATANAEDLAAGSLAARGREIAQAHCSRCHVIGDFNTMGGISSTPSFPLLVNAIPGWEERFSTFYTRRPHPAVVRMEGIAPPLEQPYVAAPVDLKLSDVDAIVSFARTLKK